MIREFEFARPALQPGAWVDSSALVIGDVCLGADSSVWPMSVLRGDVQRIQIGARSNIQDGSVLHVTHDGPFSPGGRALRIGEEVSVGHKAMLHACEIGDRCLVGMGSIVLDGAVLQEEVMLGAGSLVPGGMVLDGGYLWFGAPVRRIRALSDEERAFLAYSAAHYVRLKERHQRG